MLPGGKLVGLDVNLIVAIIASTNSSRMITIWKMFVDKLAKRFDNVV